MAGKAVAAAPVKQFTYLWEGRDRAGRTVRGEMRAGVWRWSTPPCAGRG
jgi:hypothetical protein